MCGGIQNEGAANCSFACCQYRYLACHGFTLQVNSVLAHASRAVLSKVPLVGCLLL